MEDFTDKFHTPILMSIIDNIFGKFNKQSIPNFVKEYCYKYPEIRHFISPNNLTYISSNSSVITQIVIEYVRKEFPDFTIENIYKNNTVFINLENAFGSVLMLIYLLTGNYNEFTACQTTDKLTLNTFNQHRKFIIDIFTNIFRTLYGQRILNYSIVSGTIGYNETEFFTNIFEVIIYYILFHNLGKCVSIWNEYLKINPNYSNINNYNKRLHLMLSDSKFVKIHLIGFNKFWDFPKNKIINTINYNRFPLYQMQHGICEIDSIIEFMDEINWNKDIIYISIICSLFDAYAELFHINNNETLTGKQHSVILYQSLIDKIIKFQTDFDCTEYDAQELYISYIRDVCYKYLIYLLEYYDIDRVEDSYYEMIISQSKRNNITNFNLRMYIQHVRLMLMLNIPCNNKEQLKNSCKYILENYTIIYNYINLHNFPILDFFIIKDNINLIISYN